jgi:hypothetical protein
MPRRKRVGVSRHAHAPFWFHHTQLAKSLSSPDYLGNLPRAKTFEPNVHAPENE